MSAGRATVRSEGGLLPADLLERVAALDPDLAGLRPEDYGLVPGERLNDAIVRSWTRLSGLWHTFAERLDHAPPSETTLETATRTLWVAPLLEELGYGRLTVAPPVVIDSKDYPVSHRSAGGAAVHVLGAREDLDRRTRPGTRPAHGMVQEFLNRSPDHLWAVVTNGVRLRLLRDSSALTRQAFCEFDLEAMFRGQEYADFALCWLVCHASRVEGDPPASCLLERWSNQARTDGTRALDQLRDGVEAALVALGTGFVSHPANGALRRRLETGELTVVGYHRQLLRLVYRLIFLLVAEARGLLHPPEADAASVERYRRWYSLERVVRLARRTRGSDHGDLWASLQVVFDALAGPGQPALGLAGLGSELWSTEATADLAASSLGNRALLDAVRRLCTVYDTGGRRGRAVARAVDYRNLGAEELGSVYESLLELHPVFDGHRFSLSSAAGSERKTTGSYYTPAPLIGVLLDSALNPVLDEAASAADPESALLGLRVLDPAAGSGHFLIAAAHRIAHRLAAVRSGEAEPSPQELRHALREVIAHCLFGIDVNPMAVELCKVSLWMEATEPGKPLSFLDHHIVCGNSLLGVTPRLLAEGVPDDAFKPLEGDDKDWVGVLKRRNRSERATRGQGAFDFGEGVSGDWMDLAAGLAEVEAMAEDTPDQVAAKAAAHAELVASEAAARARLTADAWCAAFVAPKTPDAPVLTDQVVRTCAQDPRRVPAEVRELVARVAQEYRFLHLHLTFPDVFAVPDDQAAPTNPQTGWSGGFDVVVGNPPWERIKLQEQEFFATRDPEIAGAPNAAARKRLISSLAETNPALLGEFRAASRHAAGQSHLLRTSGRYPLGGRGDVNTYAVFAELMRDALAPAGRMGVIVPTGIATDDTTKHFFADLVDRRSLVSLYDFENRHRLFPGIDSRIKFCLLTLGGGARPVERAEFVFFALGVEDLDDSEKRFSLSPEDFELLNPNTRTCPVFRTRRDAEITIGIYRRVPVLIREGDPDGNPWGVRFSTMFHMSNDSQLFRTRAQLEADGWELRGNHFVRGDERYVPLYEAKMIHHFDHRWATYEGTKIRDVTVAEKQDPTFVVLPRYWVPETEVVAQLDGSRTLFGFRNVTRATDERTFIAAAMPPIAAGHSLSLLWASLRDPSHGGISLASSTLVYDCVARQKLGGVNASFFIVSQLPVPAPDQLLPHRNLTIACALELTYTAWDMRGFAAELGHHGPPFRWDEERRAVLRAELDALMFHLYGVERDDVDYILDTFPIVRRKDEAAYGEYRTKRLILERYDAMAAVGLEDYESILDPPPADPSLCHPESTRPDWATEDL